VGALVIEVTNSRPHQLIVTAAKTSSWWWYTGLPTK